MVKVVAILAAEATIQKQIVEVGGLVSLSLLCNYSGDDLIHRVTTGAIAIREMNETNQEFGSQKFDKIPKGETENIITLGKKGTSRYSVKSAKRRSGDEAPNNRDENLSSLLLRDGKEEEED